MPFSALAHTVRYSTAVFAPTYSTQKMMTSAEASENAVSANTRDASARTRPVTTPQHKTDASPLPPHVLESRKHRALPANGRTWRSASHGAASRVPPSSPRVLGLCTALYHWHTAIHSMGGGSNPVLPHTLCQQTALIRQFYG
jgi:hypothetical protein